jgi:hypothetical protein
MPARFGIVWSLALLGLLASNTRGQTPSRWKAHDTTRPKPAVVIPGRPQLPAAAPSDAIVLFDGKDLSGWQSPGGQPPKWMVRDGYMESVPDAGYLNTARGFGDVQLHVEWSAPTPPEGTSQDRGNSGVFLMGLFEVQVLDNHQNDTYSDGYAGAVYGQYPPLVNATLPPGQWQAYDIVFRRPRFKPDGALERPARLTVFLNGVLVQDNVEAWGPTSWLQHQPYAAQPDKLPLALQDHGNPVRFRNIWLRELPEWDPSSPPPSADPVVNLPRELLEKYAGRYRVDEDNTYTIELANNGLRANFYGPLFLELVPHSPTTFSLRHTAAKLAFDLDKDGRPTGFEFHIGGSSRRASRVR